MSRDKIILDFQERPPIVYNVAESKVFDKSFHSSYSKNGMIKSPGNSNSDNKKMFAP